MATIQGHVKNKRGDAIGGVTITFYDKATGNFRTTKAKRAGDYTAAVDPGTTYAVIVSEEGYSSKAPDVSVPAGAANLDFPIILGESTSPLGSPGGSPAGSPVGSPILIPANGLLKMLEDPAFSIEADINDKETLEAIQLFARVNLVLGTKVRGQIGGQERDDILGIRSLYYGLSDNSLANRLVTTREAEDPTATLWDVVETELTDLERRLKEQQSDFAFIAREAKRQFNLGTENNVVANTLFPSLFMRLVDISSNPRLSFDIRKESRSDFSDKTRVYEAIDLMRELKQVILQIVRSLSRYGTAATKHSNKIWGELAEDALAVLKKVADRRAGDDQDELTTWATLALLTGQNREVLFPYIAMARHGTRLLQYAKELYDRSSNGKLEDFEEGTLLDLFQPENQEFYTTKLRREAYLIKRYPLPNWG